MTNKKPLITHDDILKIQKRLNKKTNYKGNPIDFALRYKKRKGYFAIANCDFDPRTGLGHSYSWYEITKVIGRTLVLNTYSYSNCTAKHKSKLWTLFEQLGLDFKTIQAPSGLQNLDAAMVYQYKCLAAAMVRNKYGRGKLESLKHWHDAIKFLSRQVSKHALSPFLENAENDRRAKLDWAKRRKAERAEYLAKRELEHAQRLQLIVNNEVTS